MGTETRELELLRTIREALKHLRNATPKDRNGPCVKAIGILEQVLIDQDSPTK